jgi:hypothetical protein
MRPGGADQAPVRAELQREAVGPVLVRELGEVAALGRACVADEEIDPAESRDGLVDERRRRCRLAQIGGMDERAPSRLRDAGGGRLESFSRARRERRIAAFARQLRRDCRGSRR